MSHSSSKQVQSSSGIDILGDISSAYGAILTPAALKFIQELTRNFGPRISELLDRRVERQKRLDAGELPDFLEDTADIRAGDWKVAPLPDDLMDRRVEITGPVDRKMIINALNSGARVFMADFEDSSAPTWDVMLQGQVNLSDAIDGSIEFTAANGKHYSLNENIATLFVRPRGWHLVERHAELDGKPVPASLWDFGLCFFHNANKLIDRGSGPYFYLPKLQSHLEARLWNDVFVFAQDALDIPHGTIKATVLIETILAAFEMDEILYELREHSAGLNCGRWDYIFSFIKCFRKHPEFVLPDRNQVTMSTHFLHCYSKLAIKTCHKRGVHAIGGMAAQIPAKDPNVNEMAEVKVRRDKEREAGDGHDGSWVSHPAMVPLCEEVFNQYMPNANQIDKQYPDLHVTRADLLKLPEGTITMQGLMNNVSASLRYTESWLGGQGAVPLYNLMEDAATAEIARAQLWQWVQYPKGVLDDGREITADLFRQALANELGNIRLQLGDEHFNSRKYQLAAELLEMMITGEELPEFLTLEAYDYLD
ncbi:MAG: malate synthase A [Gammaproteobacteria bacterium]